MLTIEEVKTKLQHNDPNNKTLYQALEHPDFSDWKVQQPCQERWKLIWSQLIYKKPGTVLDLGCHTGWFCRKFSHNKWKATGIDKNKLEIEIASEFMEPFNGINQPIYKIGDFRYLPLPSFSVILFLSVVMYIFQKGNPKEGWNVLKELSYVAPKMFMDFGGMYANRLPFSQKDAGDQICENTQYNSYKLLGTTNLENRPLFVFER